MKLIVPFLYEALIIKPRCRKPVLITVSDTVEVDIQEVSSASMPVAMRIGSTELRWDGERLWDFDYQHVADQSPRKVTLQEVETNTANPSGYRYSRVSAAAPFKNFWDSFPDSMVSRHKTRECGLWLNVEDADYESRDDVAYREWVDDNREALMAFARQKASALRVVDGYMHTPAGEPRYVVMTFGLGNNHGGTGMFVHYSYNPNIPNTSYFDALNYEEACLRADAVAKRRGDNKSIPVRPNGGHTIEVLIPEAVRVDPARQHGQGCEFINSIEGGIQAAGPVGGIVAAIAGIQS